MDGGGKKVEKRSRVERRSQASPYARSTVAPPSTVSFALFLRRGNADTWVGCSLVLGRFYREYYRPFARIRRRLGRWDWRMERGSRRVCSTKQRSVGCVFVELEELLLMEFVATVGRRSALADPAEPTTLPQYIPPLSRTSPRTLLDEQSDSPIHTQSISHSATE